MTALALLLSLVFPAAVGCDAGLWAHVYRPTRLHVLERCVTVTGTIADASRGTRRDGVRVEADGDTHGWLHVDPAFTSLLDVGNRADEGGNLVYEAVCTFHVRQADAIAACRGYHSSVALQPIGTRVAITGTLVQDGRHAHWNEIHPVTSIRVINRKGA